MKIEFKKDVGKCPICENEKINWQVTNYHDKGIIIDLMCANNECRKIWRLTENDNKVVQSDE